MTLAIPIKSYARIAGALYLVIAVFGAFAIGYVPSIIVAAGDPATTATKLMANQGLFGLGVFADLVVMLTEIVLSVMLFVLLKPTSPTLSMVALVSRLTMVVVMAVNLLIHIMPLALLRGAADPNSLSPELLQSVAVLFEAHRYGIYVWDMFFGAHLAALGYLVFRSGYFPRLLGIAIMIGSLGYFLEGLVKVTFLENGAVGLAVVGLLVVATVSELAFAFWLLIKGLTLTAWNEAVNASGIKGSHLATQAERGL
jgi:hypothetical protein